MRALRHVEQAESAIVTHSNVVAAGHARSAEYPDRIFLSDHVVATEIGAFQPERGQRQRLRFNVTADLSTTQQGPGDDNVDSILSYDVLLDAIADELAAGRVNLLETLAERIAARLLAYDQIDRVTLRLEKLDRCDGALGIEITRAAQTARPVPDPTDRPVTRILVIPDTWVGDRDLPERLVRAAATGPLIVCVAADGAARQAPEVVARRIDLLGFDQAAWRLAARDPRFIVVGTRTELEWGRRNGQISVWAPSRMLVDSGDGAPASPLTVPDLAVWLSHRLVGTQVAVFGGVAVPPGATAYESLSEAK